MRMASDYGIEVIGVVVSMKIAASCCSLRFCGNPGGPLIAASTETTKVSPQPQWRDDYARKRETFRAQYAAARGRRPPS